MHPNFYLLWFFVTTAPHVTCLYNLCHSRKNDILSDEECSDLYFEPSEKATNLGHINLALVNDTLQIIPRETSWNAAFLRVSRYVNKEREFCSKLMNKGVSNYCINLTSNVRNDTFLLEYKAEKLPETNSRKFLFTLPCKMPLFPYVELTDTARLILRAEKYPSTINITHYKVEGFKEKSNVTDLQDFRLFPYTADILYELYTYNDEGNYYFAISVMSGDDLCLKITTPNIYIGRKSTRLVIGIVGASFILPFVFFIFHILTKKYSVEENRIEQEEGVVVAYKSSFKKHNEVVVNLAALIEKFSIERINVTVMDLARPSKNIALAGRVIYVAPPQSDPDALQVDKATAEKEIYAVTFDYTTDRWPHFLDGRKIFKLFGDFDRFLAALSVSEPFDNSLYADLLRKADEAKLETERLLDREIVPRIVVTEEPQECDSLITSGAVL